jgi:hypothetical protein
VTVMIYITCLPLLAFALLVWGRNCIRSMLCLFTSWTTLYHVDRFSHYCAIWLFNQILVSASA